MFSPISNSFNSTKQRFIDSYEVDPNKYKRKGIGAYVGYLIIISYFTLLPKLFEAILPFVIEYIPNKLIMGIGNVSLNIIVMLIYNGAMYFIYKAKHPFFEQYRIQKDRPWPWEENYDQWIKLVKKTAKWVAFNCIFLNCILALPDSYFTDYKYSVDEIPETKTIIWQFLFFLFVEDFFLYMGHSSMHLPQLYWIHKHHHEYHTAISIAGQFSHPIEHIVANTFPSFIGYKVLSYFYPVHCISVWVFLVFRVVESIDSHTGYEWSWAQSELLPFSAGAACHVFHHTKNAGNFGSFFKIWDSLFGTNVEYIKYRKQQEMQQIKKLQKSISESEERNQKKNQ